jgi:hypothetical protein
LASNPAHIFVLWRRLIILYKNIVEGILHFRRWKLGVNHPTIGISQHVHSSPIRSSASHCKSLFSTPACASSKALDSYRFSV